MAEILPFLMTGFAFFVIAVSPGPATISNAIVAMSRGRNASLIYGAGLSSGLVFWGLIAASGMVAVLQSSVYLLMILKIFGGFYLIWLAYLSCKATINNKDTYLDECSNVVSGKKWFLRGVLLNISNPKTVIAWLAALSVGLESGDNSQSLVAYVLTCTLVGFVINAAYSIVFSYKGMMKVYQKINHWINGLASVFFAIAGLSLLRSAFNRNPLYSFVFK